MKRMTLIVVAALAAALAVFVMAGCGSQSASSSSGQSKDELITELNDALANVPEFKSVTVTEEVEATFTIEDAEAADDSSASAAASEAASSESAASNEAASSEAASSEAASSESAAASEETGGVETISTTTVYKFDMSDDVLKTSMLAEIEDIKIQYISEGDKAVCITDGPVYSGTTAQFDKVFFAGFEAYLDDTIGDIGVLIDCAAEVEKLESEGLTFYMLTLDPEKYIASDEILQLLADAGSPVKEAFLTIGFEEDGSVCSIDLAVSYENSTTAQHLMFTDYNSTTVDPMPAADKTFEEMEADIQAKLDALEAELDMTEGLEIEASSSETAEAR